MKRIALLVFTALVATPLAARAEDAKPPASYESLLTPLLATGQTIIGETIVYPSGTPKVTAAIVTVPPGKETGWHTHQVPLFAEILEGELTVDYGSKGVKTYKVGDSLLEAMNWPHNGMNKGAVPVKLLAVYMGAEGIANATPAKGPE
ncbi:MAG: cupin domain-containing protein [Rhizobiales bacterium]|nr:cupin domain-containing protein [Hyphomicrobiales bacterium]